MNFIHFTGKKTHLPERMQIEDNDKFNAMDVFFIVICKRENLKKVHSEHKGIDVLIRLQASNCR